MSAGTGSRRAGVLVDPQRALFLMRSLSTWCLRREKRLLRPRCTLPGVRAQEIISSVSAIGDQVRYIAVANGQDVELWQRPGLAEASSGESDRYEELLVNPVLLLLTRQRGEIDCGGLRYVIVRYGNFAQVVVPHSTGGHVSVAVSTDHDPVVIADAVEQLLD